ncbi:MAG: hypothetical protein LBI66_02110 [Burkholderiaceae bacterium]|jgi:hypothetical protein|nr:hypothetical protein [Burkholderiaceae bacterium]
MSALALQRNAIVALLDSVPQIGIVQDRERHAASDGELAALFTYTPPAGGTAHIRGWWLRRASTAEHGISTARTVSVHQWTVHGYLAIADAQASELLLDELVEQFRALVRADPSLGGTCQPGPLAGSDDRTDGVQVVAAEPVDFAGVRCHSVVLQLRTWSYL